MAGKFAEKFMVLDNVIQGLKVQLYQTKKILESPETRPWLFTEPGMQKIVNALQKNFPQPPENMQKVCLHW